MADELAESVLCGALRGIRISDGVVEEEKEGEEKEEGEEEEEGESETSTGCEIGKVLICSSYCCFSYCRICMKPC